MPLWMTVVSSLVICALLVVLLVAGIVLRRRWIIHQGVSLELSVNTHTEHSAKGWMLGIGVYGDSELLWYRTFSFALRPRHRFERGTVLIDGRRMPLGIEADALHDGHVIVSTRNRTDVRQFALDPDDLTTMLSWLESSPPGRDVDKVL